MAPKNIDESAKKIYSKGAWTAEEDRKLAQYIEVQGARKWKTLATKSGLNRCGKSCRMRWLNYLRPNIKRGNISDEEEDLILRLHRLLGNRWSLIAGRLPGRTDNEIKNYWNFHLRKKINQTGITTETLAARESMPQTITSTIAEVEKEGREMEANFDVNEFFDFSNESTYGLEWVSNFLELDDDQGM